MISERDILDAIEEVEKQPDTFAKAAKLATFYSLLDHLYPRLDGYSADFPQIEPANGKVGDFGDSEFLRMIRGKDISEVMGVLDELMDAVAILMPKLYDGVIRKLRGV